jgi:hypothetical protein
VYGDCRIELAEAWHENEPDLRDPARKQSQPRSGGALLGGLFASLVPRYYFFSPDEEVSFQSIGVLEA